MSVLDYNAERKHTNHKNDLPNSKLTFFHGENTLATDLIFFTDGVSFIKSYKRIFWPIWLFLAQ